VLVWRHGNWIGRYQSLEVGDWAVFGVISQFGVLHILLQASRYCISNFPQGQLF